MSVFSEVVLLALMGIIAGLLLIQFKVNQRSSTAVKEEKENFFKAQESLYVKINELLSKNNSGKKDYISDEGYIKDSLGNAVNIITNLSEQVINRQENGMSQLVDMFAEMLYSKTNDIVEENSKAVLSLQRAVSQLATKIITISGDIEKLSNNYKNLSEQTNNTSLSFSETSAVLDRRITELYEILDKTATTAEKLQNSVLKNGEVAKIMTEVTAEFGKSANEYSVLLLSQNEKAADMLDMTVRSIQNNTEEYSKTMMSHFETIYENQTQSMIKSVSIIKALSENIKLTAEQFSQGMALAFDKLNSVFNESIESVLQTSDHVNKKLSDHAENYFNNLSNNVNKLNDTIDSNVKNLEVVTRQLDSSISGFKEDAVSSSNLFESNIEKTVSSILKELDNSLADIIGRIVSVTQSISEAADALPKAVKTIKNQNNA